LESVFPRFYFTTRGERNDEEAREVNSVREFWIFDGTKLDPGGNV